MKRFGSVEEHPKGSGRYRARARVKGRLETLISGVSEAQAEEALTAVQGLQNESDVREGVTLTQFGEGFLSRRERSGIRGMVTDRNRWKAYVDGDPIGKLAVSTLGRRDVLEWLDRHTRLAHQTRKNALNLLRVALQEAVDRELLAANPARDVRVHRAGAARAKDDLEGVLDAAEQQALVAATPEADRPVLVFALCTGLRQAEQWWLRWEDVREDRIVVRRSVGGLAPKSGKPREVFLLPPARAALVEMQRRNGLRRKPSPWVFPALRGSRRSHGKPPRTWRKALERSQVGRHVRWHDLRHTCATSLLAGWWGRKWSLDEVCRMLGHSSVQITERYARKLAETQQLAVAGTPASLFPTGNAGGAKLASPKDNSLGFVNRRSRVQIPKLAPALTRGAGERAGNEPGQLDALGQELDVEGQEAFAAALAESAERAEVAELLRRPRGGSNG